MNTFDMKFTYFELKDGWHKDEETHCWYFYEHNGMLKDCNRWIDGKYYHFNANGTLAFIHSSLIWNRDISNISMLAGMVQWSLIKY